MSPQLILTAIPGVRLVHPGDDLARLLCEALEAAGLALADGDVLALASKIVSKAEGRLVRLADVQPTARAVEIAEACDKDPRLVQLILGESVEVSRLRPGLLITRHRLGFVCANAGVDRSNVGSGAAGEEQVLLLPLDPDRSAAQIRAELGRRLGVQPGIVIADSHGRPHRMGTVGVAIGAAGLPALQDCRGQPDLFGRVLRHTEVGLADLIASAATLLFGQANEGTPAVLLRGVPFQPRDGNAAELVRPRDLDMYR
jgi:coenzyme F420-0:L-glutamate ligase/coenzyme F420-1:gamma-L-glutamate ligase